RTPVSGNPRRNSRRHEHVFSRRTVRTIIPVTFPANRLGACDADVRAGRSQSMLLLSMRLAPDAIAIIAFVIVLPCVLFLLGSGAGVRLIWNRLNGQHDKPVESTWRVFKWSVIGLGGLAWLALTVAAVRAPAGPAPEIAAVANLRTINTAEVTYVSDNSG